MQPKPIRRKRRNSIESSSGKSDRRLSSSSSSSSSASVSSAPLPRRSHLYASRKDASIFSTSPPSSSKGVRNRDAAVQKRSASSASASASSSSPQAGKLAKQVEIVFQSGVKLKRTKSAASVSNEQSDDDVDAMSDSDDRDDDDDDDDDEDEDGQEEFKADDDTDEGSDQDDNTDDDDDGDDDDDDDEHEKAPRLSDIAANVASGAFRRSDELLQVSLFIFDTASAAFWFCVSKFLLGCISFNLKISSRIYCLYFPNSFFYRWQQIVASFDRVLVSATAAKTKNDAPFWKSQHQVRVGILDYSLFTFLC